MLNLGDIKHIRTQKLDTQTEKLSTGKRFVFQGLQAKQMFQMETNIELPKLNEGEVLVKVRAATICLSDIHTVCGTRIEPTPSVLGHEACVEVVDHKRHDSGLNIGDRVTFSIADTCGSCEFCLNDLSQKCTKLFKYGHALMNNGSGFNGCYASHIVIRKGTKVIKLPNEISDSLGATINCALATMVNAVEQMPDNVKRSPNKVLVQGDGMLGLYGCALLKEFGFKQVYCSGNHPGRDKLIEKLGAIPVNIDLEELKDQSNQFDCVIEVCGVSDAIKQGITLLKPGGAYIFVGMVHPNTSFSITGESIIRKCLTLKGIHNYQGRHLESSVQFLQKNVKKYPFDEMVGPNMYGLDQLPEAIELAKTKTYPRICVKP